MTINLKNITICVVDCVTPELAMRALQKSMKLCHFQDVLLFSDASIAYGGDMDLIKIPTLDSLDAYSKFLMKDLNGYIATPYVLVIQWDGYVVDPLAWDETFLAYDYIGAKWHWHQDGKTVGNGGFSLRSKKLLNAVASSDIPFIEGVAEDEQICRIYRQKLETQFGIKFSSESVADQFSYERTLPDAPTFGFHGIFNIWRYLDDSEVAGFADQFPDSMYSSLGFYEFFLQYFLLRKFQPLNELYSRLIKRQTQEEIYLNVQKLTNDPNFARLFLALCNEMIGRSDIS